MLGREKGESWEGKEEEIGTGGDAREESRRAGTLDLLSSQLVSLLFLYSYLIDGC